MNYSPGYTVINIKPSDVLSRVKWKWVPSRWSICHDIISKVSYKIPTSTIPSGWSQSKFRKWRKENPLRTYPWKNETENS